MNPDKETAIIHEDDPIKDFHLDYKMLQRIVKWHCDNNPKFKGTTTEDRARMCGISESTYKTILSGKNAKPRIDILYAIASTFGCFIDPLVGLAPERDLDRETEHYDETFMQNAQRQLESINKELEQKREKVADLREQLSEARTEGKALAHELEAANDQNAKLQRSLARHRLYGATVSTVLALLVFTVAHIISKH